MPQEKRPRRSRQINRTRRRNVLRCLSRCGVIGPLSHIKRGSTVWLHSPEMARAKGDVDADQ